MKLLKLPFDLPELPTDRLSLIGMLARRLLTEADLTVIQPLADALRDAGRDADALEVFDAFRDLSVRLSRDCVHPNPVEGEEVNPDANRVYAWESFTKYIARVAFWDIYDVATILDLASKSLDPSTLCDAIEQVKSQDLLPHPPALDGDGGGGLFERLGEIQQAIEALTGQAPQL